ncbi:MAG: O-antigen ligase family protein [Minicystis sp.]
MVEVLKWVTYAAVFVAASAAAARHGAVWGVLTVFGAALVAALATLGHGIVGATKVYGLYQPSFHAIAWHIGPLLNPNNLAGYLNLGALCGLGLLLSHKPPLPRWILGLGVALIVAIDVGSASRAGVLALPVGVVGLSLLTRHRRDKDQSATQSASTWLIVAAVAGGALLAVLGGNDKAWSELRDKNLQKLEMLAWAKPMVSDHPLLGIGRGAFESVFPLYKPVPGNMVFTHPENFVAQWITEWGLPVGIAALAALGWAFTPRRLGARRSALAAGAWMGVAALLLQNLVDLALEIPAVTIGAATVLGSLWGDGRTHGPREELTVTRPLGEGLARAAAIAFGAIGAAAIVAALRLGAHDVAADRAALRMAFDRVTSSRAEAVAPVRAELRRAMLAHPAEPYFPLLGGMIAFRTRDQSPIPWIQRTLERARMNGRAHLLLAEVLAGRGARRQALLELRLGVENDPALVGPAASLAVRWAKTWEDLLSTVPEGAAGAPVLADMGLRLGDPRSPGDPVLRSQCDREALLRDPKLIQPRVREVEVRLQAIANGDATGVCADRAHCRGEILEHADAIAAAHPDASVAVEMRARLLVAEGKPEEAVKLLEKGCDRVAERPSCLRVRVIAAAAIKAPEVLNGASKDLLGASCVTNQACADTAEWLAGIRLSRNELGAALALLSRAAREDPNGEARWLKVAEVASRSGAHVQAADALEKVAKQRGGADPELKRRIEAERSHALGGLLKR